MGQYVKEKKEERVPDPILNLRHVKLEAKKVMEKPAIERDGKTFAPKVVIWWEIVDDHGDGSHNGARFWDNYSFVQKFDSEEYVVREGTRIGDLAPFVAHAFHGGADYFNSAVEIDFEELEGAKAISSLEPRRFKEGHPATGTRTVSETLLLESALQRVTAPAEAEEPDIDEEDFSDIPF